MRALLDGVGDERQRGGAEHPHGRLERTAQEAREQHARRPRPRLRRASGWRRRRTSAASATSRSRRTRRGRRAPGRRCRRGRAAAAATQAATARGAATAASAQAPRQPAAASAMPPLEAPPRAVDRDDSGQRQPDGRRPRARRVAQGRSDRTHLCRIVGPHREPVSARGAGTVRERRAPQALKLPLKVERVSADTSSEWVLTGSPMNLHETLTNRRSNAHAVPVAFRVVRETRRFVRDPPRQLMATQPPPALAPDPRRRARRAAAAALGRPGGHVRLRTSMIDAAANNRQITTHSTACYQQALAALPATPTATTPRCAPT